MTITTVGYGDYYPVTTLGRATATFVMLSGVGIIGALASFLASFLVAPTPAEDSAAKASADADARRSASSNTELSELRAELDRMHQTLRELVASQHGAPGARCGRRAAPRGPGMRSGLGRMG